MRLKINGKKYKYKLKYFKREYDLNVKLPSYSINNYGEVFYENKWLDCRFYLTENLGKTKISISPIKIQKDGMSEIGKVDNQGFTDTIEISKFQNFLIKSYEYIFLSKVHFLRIIDRAQLIKKNLNWIFIAFTGSIIYFLVNHYYDSYLQELINKSNLVQSIIVFLSLSSLINIFHPFTLRKEWNGGEINKLITEKNKKVKKDLEHEKYVKKNSEW